MVTQDRKKFLKVAKRQMLKKLKNVYFVEKQKYMFLRKINFGAFQR